MQTAEQELAALKERYEDLLNAAADLVGAVGQMPLPLKIHTAAQPWLTFQVSPAVKALSAAVSK